MAHGKTTNINECHQTSAHQAVTGRIKSFGGSRAASSNSLKRALETFQEIKIFINKYL